MATQVEVDAGTTSRPPESVVDVNLLKEIARKSLVDALNSVNGAKTLVLDPSLAGPLGLVTEVSLLKHHGVDKMFWLEPGALASNSPHVVYLCRPKIRHIKTIANQIKQHTTESKKYTYTLLLVPRLSTLVTQVLEDEGVLGDVVISSYNLQFIPLADDVISLENENAFRDLWVDGDETVVYDSVQALLTFQKLYGLFPRIVGKGQYAARIQDLLMREKLSCASPPDPLVPLEKLDCLIILDRRVDMITPLLTQLTYEGLIDEILGIKHSNVELPASLVSPPTTAPTHNAAGPSTATATAQGTKPNPPTNTLVKKKYHLNTMTDGLFGEIRDLNFTWVGKRLNREARRLNELRKTNLQTKSVAQLRDFVGEIKGLQAESEALRIHTGISELLVPATRTELFNKSLEIQQNLLASYDTAAQINAIEEMIGQGGDMHTILRLLCLASTTAGGIKTKVLENIKREFLQTYGYDQLPVLLSLSSASLNLLLPNPLPTSGPLATAAGTKYPFTSLRKSLRLLIDDLPEALGEVENDISFVYSGYAPISVRLVQCVAQKGGVISNPAEKANDEMANGKQPVHGRVQAHPIVGWKGFEDVVSIMPGDTVDAVLKGAGRAPGIGTMVQPQQERTTTTVVYFVGGCTHTEVAALRWVERQNKGRRFLIATTGMVTGSSMMESIARGGRS